MMRLALFWLGVVAVLLMSFAVVGAWAPAFLVDPLGWLRGGGTGAMAGSVGLLTADVLLPIPSSVLMMGNGMVFGVISGTVLNAVGGVGAAVVAFALGRWAEAWLDRWLSPAEKAHADRVLTSWGWLAIVATRPIPLLAESIALLAGTSQMRWRVMIAASVVGTLPGAWGYAAAGAATGGLESPWAVTAVVIGVAVLLWLVAIVIRGRRTVTDG